MSDYIEQEIFMYLPLKLTGLQISSIKSATLPGLLNGKLLIPGFNPGLETNLYSTFAWKTFSNKTNSKQRN